MLIGYIYPKLAAHLEYTEAELRRLQTINAQQKESEHFKNQLLLVLNHEIRAPLSAVKGYTALLQTYRDELNEEKQTRYIKQIGRACDEAIAIIASIVAGTQQDEQATELHRINLEELLQDVIDSLAPRIQEEQRQMELHIEPAHALVDPLKLRQVISNLLTNAMRYSPTGTPLQITITLQYTGTREQQDCGEASRVFISIQDQGIGISAKDQERLFQPFTRLEAGKAIAPHGSGLGLFLCKSMLAVMNGEIWIESESCEGYRTTAWVSLQIA
ncbi:MAG: HAMP domain-containing histidine kinase [Chloroflexota bacterium]|nr:HAMP domain-containing histidine kinase [Chloroflexota bacterium]